MGVSLCQASGLVLRDRSQSRVKKGAGPVSPGRAEAALEGSGVLAIAATVLGVCLKPTKKTETSNYRL